MNKKVYFSLLGMIIMVIAILSVIIVFKKDKQDDSSKISEALSLIRETYDCRISDDETYYTIYKLKTMTMNREELVIPEEVDGIPIKKIIDVDGGFMSFTNVRKIIISKNITYIGTSDNDKSLGTNIFLNANSLSTIEVDKDNQVYTSESGILYSKDMSILLRYPKRKVSEEGTLQYTIKKGVKQIAPYAFSNNIALQMIIIGDDVEKIANSAFYNCDNLTTVDFGKNSIVKEIESNVFNSCKALSKIDLPDSLEVLGNSAFLGCTNLSSIYLPISISNYGLNIFTGCINLATVRTPFNNVETLTKIRNDLSINSSAIIVAINEN